MTLDDLRDKFAKLQSKRLGPERMTISSVSDRVINDWARDDYDIEPGFDDLTLKTIAAARLYVVARDQGIQAAVLYKLQQTG